MPRRDARDRIEVGASPRRDRHRSGADRTVSCGIARHLGVEGDRGLALGSGDQAMNRGAACGRGGADERHVCRCRSRAEVESGAHPEERLDAVVVRLDGDHVGAAARGEIAVGNRDVDVVRNAVAGVDLENVVPVHPQVLDVVVDRAGELEVCRVRRQGDALDEKEARVDRPVGVPGREGAVAG